MELLREFWWLISTPEGLQTLIAWGGIPVMTAIVFAETGLLVGFFLPGDSLLFVAGFLASPAGSKILGERSLPVFWLIVILSAAAIVGDTVGYWIGNKAGPPIFNRPQSRFFRRDHLIAAHAFYERHGGKTIVLARFMPFIRTFAPVVAGAAAMTYRHFLAYNVFGGVGWVMSITLIGYYLGRIAWIRDNLEKAVVIVVLLSLSPMFIHYFLHRRRRSAAAHAKEEYSGIP
ncbi:MAG: VTT domain-containing protein [Planctomycetota bacterium]